MFIKVVADWVHCGEPTEHGALNDRDEVYFVATGGTSDGPVSSDKTRVSPPPPEDYYQFKQGWKQHGITLWEGYLPDQGAAGLSFLMNEQDNAQLQLVKNLAVNLAGQFVAGNAAFLATGSIDYANLVNAAKELTADLFAQAGSEGDQTIGAFDVVIQNLNGKVKVNWGVGSGTAMLSPGATSLNTQLDLHNNGKYGARLSVQRSNLVRIVNAHSGKALDVPSGTGESGIQLQQYTPGKGRNQAWLIEAAGGVALALGAIPPIVPTSYIYNDANGLCLDLRGGKVTDGTPVQQFPFHGGIHQTWGLARSAGHPSEFGIASARSGTVLDIAGASEENQALLQVHRSHGGANQRWRLEPVVYPLELAP